MKRYIYELVAVIGEENKSAVLAPYLKEDIKLQLLLPDDNSKPALPASGLGGKVQQ
jgi:hypothetical protein